MSEERIQLQDKIQTDTTDKVKNIEQPVRNAADGILVCIAYLIVIFTFPISLLYCIRVIQEYERAVIFRLGKIRRGEPKGPGVFFILPCIERYIKVDLRTVAFDVPPQEILSKDSVTVTVDAVVYYRVYKPIQAVINIQEYSLSTQLLAATTLRNVMGSKELSEVLEDREGTAQTMQAALDDATHPWGVKVERVEIKDVRLPVQMQRVMAAEAEASRLARAKFIAAKGEKMASVSLQEAACILDEHPAAMQLRYLQTLSTISAEKNSTIIFPVPLEFVDFFMRRHKTSADKKSDQ